MRLPTLPIIGWMRDYDRAWLRLDVLAGITVLALLVPEGMAYAQLAGMPPQAAFYAAPIGLLAYAILGTSRQLVLGACLKFPVLSRGGANSTVSALASGAITTTGPPPAPPRRPAPGAVGAAVAGAFEGAAPAVGVGASTGSAPSTVIVAATAAQSTRAICLSFIWFASWGSVRLNIVETLAQGKSIDRKDVAMSSEDFWFLARLQRKRRFEKPCN